MAGWSRSLIAMLATASLGAAVSCTDGQNPPAAERTFRTVSQDYLPGLAADLFLPTGASSAPVVVMVPGGAWRTADREGLTPLAEHLAAAGIVAVNTTHRAVAAGGRFPGPVENVVCSVDFAVRRAADEGIVASTVVVLGHSSGAHLAALAALGTDEFRPACPHPESPIDALIGLAGTYDVTRLAELAAPLFGGAPAAQAPDEWRQGNPLTWVRQGARRADLEVFLAHGTADVDLPPSFTTDFADALDTAGYDVTVDIVPAADHHTLYSADVIGPRVVDWVHALTSRRSPS
jgi:acetyl esterase/lipase